MFDIVKFVADITILIGGFAYILKFVRAELKHMHESIHKTRSLISMLTMHAETIDIKERIDAGNIYIKLGGNGSEKMYFNNLKKLYEKHLKEKDERSTLKPMEKNSDKE
jgi:uncharacterized protein YutE (UPF0331/DUF86 family)